jgi:membrane associated rhomboid family serine protease
MTAGDHRPGVDVVGVLGVILVCAGAVLAGLLEMVLVPVYSGSTPVPIAVVLAVASNIVFPLLGYRIVPRPLAAIAPLVCWLIVVLVFGVMARPEGDVILPGGSLQLVSYGVILGGALAGTLSVVIAIPPRSRRSAISPPNISAGTDPGSPRPAPPGRR